VRAFQELELAQPAQRFRHAQCIHGVADGKKQLAPNYLRPRTEVQLGECAGVLAEVRTTRLDGDGVDAMSEQSAECDFGFVSRALLRLLCEHERAIQNEDKSEDAAHSHKYYRTS
jgi:hypothetical protein